MYMYFKVRKNHTKITSRCRATQANYRLQLYDRACKPHGTPPHLIYLEWVWPAMQDSIKNDVVYSRIAAVFLRAP